MGNYMEKEKRLTELVTTSGCNAKLPPGDLNKVMMSLPLTADKRIIGGYDKADDALVFDMKDGTVMLQTVDFFPPMVDDPYLFGQIASANAISDIYAMGGDPVVAMSVMCFPSCLDLSVMKKIMEGALDKCSEAGITIAGGHTISDKEPKFGLAVTGFAKKARVWTNGGAKEGDVIILTKKIGIGILMTSLKAGEAEGHDISVALNQMKKLNKEAKDKAMDLSVNAATDVTGFSLLGHCAEMAEASGVTIEINSTLIPILSGVMESARFGLIPEGRYTNEDYIGSKVGLPNDIDPVLKDVLFSPETSGGLLLSMRKEDADRYKKRVECFEIGKVAGKKEKPVLVT